MFFIKNLEDLQSIPSIFKDSIIEKAFDKANIANFDRAEASKYRESLKIYWDMTNVIETAVQDGFAQGVETGIQQEKLLTIQNAKAMGLSDEMISQLTGLTLAQIQGNL